MELPLLRALLRTLLFAVTIEAVFYRLLTIQTGATLPTVEDLRLSTSRGGAFMFFMAFLLLVPTLVIIAYAALRRPAWPGSLNAAASLGLLALVALGISASLGPRGPAFALGFAVIATLLSLAMLAGMFESREDTAGKAFAVVLAAAMVSLLVQTAGDRTALLGFNAIPQDVAAGAAASARWLLFACGALAYPAFCPASARPSISAASYGVSAASAFTVIVGVVVHPPLLSRIESGLGPLSSGPIALIATAGAASAAVFLMMLTVFRAFPDPLLHARACGLLFLMFAGFPHEIAYQHLLAILGVALLTASAPLSPTRSGSVFVVPAPGSSLEPPCPSAGSQTSSSPAGSPPAQDA